MAIPLASALSFYEALGSLDTSHIDSFLKKDPHGLLVTMATQSAESYSPISLLLRGARSHDDALLLDLVQRLLAHGFPTADPNSEHWPILLACQSSLPLTADFLIAHELRKHDVKPWKTLGNTHWLKLAHGVFKNRTRTQSSSFDPERDLFASQSLKVLLKHDIPIDYALPDSDEQRTPLLFAANRLAPQCIKILLEAGARPNELSCYGRNALHEAVLALDLKYHQIPEDTTPILTLLSLLLSHGVRSTQLNALGRLPSEIIAPSPFRHFIESHIESFDLLRNLQPPASQSSHPRKKPTRL